MSLFSHFLTAMFGVKVSAAERPRFVLPLWLGGLGISNPVSLAFDLFTSSVCSTEHLVRSIVGFETFELDAHFDHSFNKQFYRQWVGATFDEEFDQLLTLFNHGQFCGPRLITFPHDSLSCLWVEVSLICQHRSLGVVLLYVIKSYCYLYLLYVMVVEHHLLVSMLLIVAVEIWSLIDIMRFGMLLVTLLLWFGYFC